MCRSHIHSGSRLVFRLRLVDLAFVPRIHLHYAFLASAAGTLALQNRTMPRISDLNNTAFEDCLAFWSDSTSSVSLIEPMSHKQLAWDGEVVGYIRESLFTGCVSSLDVARFLAACAPHSGDWLNAIPIQSCGLLLNDDEVRIAVGLRMGLPLFLQHDCVCGDVMDTLGLHGLACKSGAEKQARRSIINVVVCRSMIRAKIHSVKEPAGLCDGGLRPDGASIIPWKRGRNVTWDVTVADTFATSYVTDAAICAERVAERAAAKKIAKYAEMCRNYIFVPLACEVSGVWCTDDLEFLNDLGSRISDVTGDTRDTGFLFQRLSIAFHAEGERSLHVQARSLDWHAGVTPWNLILLHCHNINALRNVVLRAKKKKIIIQRTLAELR